MTAEQIYLLMKVACGVIYSTIEHIYVLQFLAEFRFHVLHVVYFIVVLI